MLPAKFNLLIPQGSDFYLTVLFTEGRDDIRLTADVAAGTLSLPCNPLRYPIADGRKLLFDDDIKLVVDGDVAVGAIAIPVVSCPIPLTKNWQGDLIADLTGYDSRASVKKKPTDTVALGTFAPSFSLDPFDGTVTYLLDASQTSAPEFLPNLKPGVFLTENELQKREYRNGDYLWNAKLIDASGVESRKFEGLVVVTYEVTP